MIKHRAPFMMPLPRLLAPLLMAALCVSIRAAELRGLWVDAFNPGMKTASQVSQLVADARAGNFNALFVQVRKRGDAYYNSTLEPKAADVSPQSFDPLADLIEKANTGGPKVEVHAWIVTYNIWNQQSAPPAQSTHPWLLHPDWLTENYTGTKWDGNNYAFDQALPEVQAHTFAVCQDILSRYAVDGLHFDYIRYSDSGSSVGNQPWGYHPVALQRFRALTGRTDRPLPSDTQWLQFRRDQVTALVRKVYLNAWKIRPNARISAATICYGSAPGASLSSWHGSEAWGRVLQDWRGWLEEGMLDLAVPMIYRNYAEATRRAEYDAWCAWTRDRQYGRSAAAGAGIYLNAVADGIREIKQSRVASASASLAGVVGYAYSTPTTSSGVSRAEFIDALTNDAAAEVYEPGGTPVFATAASPPPMPWKTDASRGHLMGTLTTGEGAAVDGATVTITGPANRTLTTDATGFFGSVDLPPGSYAVTVSLPGHEPVSQSVTVTGALVAEANLTLISPDQPFVITEMEWNRPQRQITLTWNSRATKSYRIELSANLTSWIPLASGVPTNGASTTWTSLSLPVASRHFFRVVEE